MGGVWGDSTHAVYLRVFLEDVSAAATTTVPFIFCSTKPLKMHLKGSIVTLAVQDYPQTAAADKLASLTSVKYSYCDFIGVSININVCMYKSNFCHVIAFYVPVTTFESTACQGMLSLIKRESIFPHDLAQLFVFVCACVWIIISVWTFLCLFIPSVLRNTGRKREAIQCLNIMVESVQLWDVYIELMMFFGWAELNRTWSSHWGQNGRGGTWCNYQKA